MPNTSVDQQWYVARNGQQRGPISRLELSRHVALGEIRPSDLFWREGFEQWVDADTMLNEMASFPANNQTNSPNTGSIILRGLLAVLAPTRRFYGTVFSMARAPAQFSCQHIKLGDQTNFLRGARLYLESLSYSFLWFGLFRLISRQPIISSEYRHYLWYGIFFATMTLAFWLSARLFVGRRVTIVETLHLESYALSYTSALTALFLIAFAVLEAALSNLGVELFSATTFNAFQAALHECLSTRSILHAVMFGTEDAISSGTSYLALVVRTGVPLWPFLIWSAAIMIGAQVGISISRTVAWISTSILVSYLLFFGGMIGAMYYISSNADCLEDAYYRLGKKDPKVLLTTLERDLNVGLPLPLSDGTQWLRVSAVDNGIILYFQTETKDRVLDQREMTSLERDLLIENYCNLKGPFTFVNALGRLNLNVRVVRYLPDHNWTIDVQARRADCKSSPR